MLARHTSRRRSSRGLRSNKIPHPLHRGHAGFSEWVERTYSEGTPVAIKLPVHGWYADNGERTVIENGLVAEVVEVGQGSTLMIEGWTQAPLSGRSRRFRASLFPEKAYVSLAPLADNWGEIVPAEGNEMMTLSQNSRDRARRSSNKETSELIQKARAQGWNVFHSGSGHWIFRSPDKSVPQIVVASTPGGGNRSLENAIARLKRGGLVMNATKRDCSKCGGSGYIQRFGHYAQGVCFDCGGTGVPRQWYGRRGLKDAEPRSDAERIRTLIADLRTMWNNYVTGRKAADGSLEDYFYSWAQNEAERVWYERQERVAPTVKRGKELWLRELRQNLDELRSLGEGPKASEIGARFQRQLGLPVKPNRRRRTSYRRRTSRR